MNCCSVLSLYLFSLLPHYSKESLTESRFAGLENQIQTVTRELTDLKQQCKIHADSCSRNCSEKVQRGSRAAGQFVAFSATINRDISPISNNEVIVFDHVITNVGGAYDPYIGRFRATVSGFYHFVVTIMSYSTHYIEIELLLEGSLLCRARASSTYNAMGTCAVTIHMNENSDVWVRHSGSTGDYIKGGYYPSFTGYLVKAD